MSCLSLRINRYLLAVSAQSFKSYNTVSSCEQCVIRAAAYVLTRVDVSSSLTNENVSGNYCLTVSTLNAESLSLGITAVLDRTHTFLMREELH